MKKRPAHFVENFVPVLFFWVVVWYFRSVYLWEYVLSFEIARIFSTFIGLNVQYRWINFLLFRGIFGSPICFLLVLVALVWTAQTNVSYKGQKKGQHSEASLFMELLIWMGFGWYEVVIDTQAPPPEVAVPCHTYTSSVDYDIVRRFERKAEILNLLLFVVVFISLVFMGMTPLGGVSIFWVFFLALGLFVASRLEVAPRHQMLPMRGGPESSHGGFPKGIAKIYLRTPNPFPVPVFSDYLVGHGYASGGILHTRGHVTYGNPVYFRQDGQQLRKSECHYWDKNCDVATYGGSPAFVAVRGGDKLRIMLGTNVNHYVVMDSVASVQVDGMVTYRMGITSPGTSGSPVFVLKDDVYHLAAVTGKWTRSGDSNSEQCELFMKSIATEDRWHLQVGTIIDVCQHPGAGKTRTIVPQILKSAADQGMTVILAAPTRVVAKELVGSMEQMGQSVHVDIKGEQTVFRKQRVVITTHATLLRKLIGSKGRYIKVAKCIVMDESHVSNLSTVALVKLCRSRADSKQICFVQMSATMRALSSGEVDMKFQQGSNYDIVDEPIVEFEKCVEEIKRDPKRELIFVASKQKMLDMRNRFVGDMNFPIFEMRRETFDSVYPRIRQFTSGNPGNPYVVIATNIAETGFNCPLDRVWDSQVRLLPIMSTTIPLNIRFTTRAISMDQYIQRRGRVGRQFPGEYRYVRRGNLAYDIGDRNDAERFDLVLLSRTFEWAHKELLENEEELQQILPDVIPSPQVVDLWLNDFYERPSMDFGMIHYNAKTLLGFYLTHSAEGYVVPCSQMRERINRVWRVPPGQTGGLSIHVQNKPDCCLFVRWYDQRDSDLYDYLLRLHFGLDMDV